MAATRRKLTKNAKGKGPIGETLGMIDGVSSYITKPISRAGAYVDRGIGQMIGKKNPTDFNARMAGFARRMSAISKSRDVEALERLVVDMEEYRNSNNLELPINYKIIDAAIQQAYSTLRQVNRNPLAGTERFSREAEAKAYKRLVEAEGLKAKVEFEPDLKGEKWVVRVTGKNSRKRNPESDAADMYSSFHGKSSDSIAEFIEEEHYHGHLASLGQLIELKVYTITGLDATFCFDYKGKPAKDVILASNENGTALYMVGGDQSLDLASVKMDKEDYLKDSMVMGDCYFVSYFTEKDFDKFTPTIYEHELGEESGELPVLRYDRLNERIYLDGGAYVIKKPLMRTSDGIEN